MSYIEWSDEYSVKHATIDQQHQTLFGYINEFYEGCSRQSSNAELTRIFEKIIDYTSYHFKDEETLMEKGNYPQLTQHQVIHKHLVLRVLEFKKMLETNEDGIVAEQIKYFLKNWLISHIKGIDLPYTKYIQEITLE